jgi:hypothetical protein
MRLLTCTAGHVLPFVNRRPFARVISHNSDSLTHHPECGSPISLRRHTSSTIPSHQAQTCHGGPDIEHGLPRHPPDPMLNAISHPNAHTVRPTLLFSAPRSRRTPRQPVLQECRAGCLSDSQKGLSKENNFASLWLLSKFCNSKN